MKACTILNPNTEPIGLYTRPRALNACITTSAKKSDGILKILGVRKTILYLFFVLIKKDKCLMILEID